MSHTGPTPPSLRTFLHILLVAASATHAAGQAGSAGAGKQPSGDPAKLSRWLELQTSSVTSRYRYIEDSGGAVVENQCQYQDVFRGRFKIDNRGQYSVNAGVASGRSFTSSWNATGWGTGEPVSNHYLKQLYFSGTPGQGIEFQYGGLYLLRGESTEITSYDNDGYIVGQRLSLKRPRELFFDEVSITYGYFGDETLPNLNKRFNRLKRSNYHQWLVVKNIGPRAGLSVGYTFNGGIETLRQAVRVRTPELRVVDLIRFENYQRTDVQPDFGFAVFSEKTLQRRLTIGGGYTDIDRNYGGLNGDRWVTGRRLFAAASFAVCPEFTISAYATRAVKTGFPIANATRVDIVFSYNLLESLKRTSLF